jgi:hypothetical protein
MMDGMIAAITKEEIATFTAYITVVVVVILQATLTFTNIQCIGPKCLPHQNQASPDDWSFLLAQRWLS